MAVGLGGTAVAGSAFAVTQFDTLRAAASVPVVILLIGVVTWPSASELMDSDVRTELIKWMGVVLAASGVAEAAKQVGQAAASAKVAASGQTGDVKATGDFTT